MKQRPPAPVSLAAVVAIAAGAVLTAALVATLRYGLVEGRALLLVGVAYSAVGLCGFRFPAAGAWLPPWSIAAGVALAILELANIGLEQFVGLPSPANAVVPASMMAVLALTASTVAVVESSREKPFRGVVTAVLVVGLGMLLSVAAVLLFVVVRAASHAEAVPLLGLTCANATTHLTLPLPVAAAVGSAAVAVAAGASRLRRRASVVISLAGIAVIAAGVGLLVAAASRPRAERPPLVVPGMALSALGLVLLPCILGRHGRPGSA